MPDLNTMLLAHAKSSLENRLSAAVTNGDTEEAAKVAKEMADLEVANAPKPQAGTAYGNTEITAELNKLPWFGVDPKKSQRTLELGKHLDPKKFATAADFAAALVKSVEEEFKPAAGDKADDETDDDEETEKDEDETPKPAPKPRRTDAPGEGDAGGAAHRGKSGPWSKISDAPPDVQKEIRRAADKFAPKTEDGRKQYIAKALEAHYGIHQRKQGK